MTTSPTIAQRQALAAGWDPDPSRSLSLSADAHPDLRWFDVEAWLVPSKTHCASTQLWILDGGANDQIQEIQNHERPK
ncbi:MAG: hypothetical protein CL446_05905 [Acidimicrobiaceae bacterium]|nr:hypothetical protein [Acidimicrobiaceae bacterium]